jgi:hypothetical protein
MAGFDGASGIMTRWRARTTSAQLSGDGGSVSIEEASEGGNRHWENGGLDSRTTFCLGTARG